MKFRSICLTALCSLVVSAGFTSCSDDEDVPEVIIDPVEKPVYILNEGSWEGNNANISLFYPNVTGLGKADFYQEVNERKMGDLANAMVEEDGNIYVVVSGSKYVARLDANCKEQARHEFPEGEGEPRCLDVEDGYVYVTQYGGQVTKLDAQTLKVVGTFFGGDNLEGIVEENGKLYVANAWKIDGSGNYLYNKEVLVINAATMTQENTIVTVDNPEKIYEIDDKLYLLSKGDYVAINPALQVIDIQNNSASPVTNAAKITKGNNGLIYGVRSAYDAEWNTVNSFFTYNPATGVVSEATFLQDAPASFSSAAIYLLEVDEENGRIYVGTSDYVTNGTIYQFDASGKLLQQFDSGGINPSALVFID